MDSFTISFADLRAAFIDASRGKGPLANAPYAREWFPPGGSYVRDSFYGCSGAEMVSWLRDGYKVKPLTGIKPGGMVTSSRRRLRCTDEGELNIGLALSGHDYPFEAWTPRKRKPGLRVNVELGFRGGVPADVIEKYGAWTAAACGAFEAAGFDLVVNVVSRASGYLGRGNIAEVLVRVKSENERSHIRNWSAMFSPGAHRMLMFAARQLHQRARGREPGSPGGSILSPSWNVTYEASTRTVTFHCPADAGRFNERAMTEALQKVRL